FIRVFFEREELMHKRKLFAAGAFLVSAIFLVIPFYEKVTLVSRKGKAFGNLERRVEDYINQAQGDFSILIKDLNYPEFKIVLKEKEKFAAASLIKVPLAAVALKAVREGKLSLSQKITIKRKDITGGSGIIKGMQLPVSLSLQETLELMIARSDNTATNKIIGILGFEYINESFKDLGLSRTTLTRKMMDFYSRKKGVENYTTALDLCLIFERIYKGLLIDKEASELLLSFLKKQKVNDRLPRYLAKGLSVAHKTGLEKGVVHDAGIIFSPKGDYVICVLARGVGNYKQVKKFIAKLSLLTYNFYQ
ncbi:MAG: serine hydrolase, partial [Candidatus Omnitrophota bacterium]